MIPENEIVSYIEGIDSPKGYNSYKYIVIPENAFPKWTEKDEIVIHFKGSTSLGFPSRVKQVALSFGRNGEPHQSTTKIPTVTLKQRAQTTEPPRRRKVKWGDDLPQDFFERMDYFAQSSMVRHQDLIQKIRFEVQRQTEEALATQHRLSRDQVQSADSGITEDVSLPAIFMPSKNGVVFSPKARKYFHPPGSREPRLSQPPSVFRLPNMGSTPVLNLFDLSQKNVVQKGPGWLYKTCKDVTKR